MSENKKYKICIVGNMFGRGGSERAHSNLSKYFHKQGIQVHNVIFEDGIEYDFSGELLNLGKVKHTTISGKINRYKLLYNYIKKHQFDYVIDLRYRGTFYGEWALAKYIFGQTKYIPSIRGFRFDRYFSKSDFLAKKLFSKAYAIVAVSKEMENEIRKLYGYQNLTTIYNIVETDTIRKLSQEEVIDKSAPYIMALGRMHPDNIKQQDEIIKAYSQSVLPEKGIKLLLVGDGEKRKDFQQLAKDLKLTDKVIFTGFKANPYPYLKDAEFMVLASKNEGFPNVLLESFACQTPVVSYDCKTGPSEIINHKHNGLLVENQNREKLVEAMNVMVENQELYQFCKSNTLSTALEFSPENIGRQWLKLMKIEI